MPEQRSCTGCAMDDGLCDACYGDEEETDESGN